ncbi:NAD(P)-dependent dehydrogenase, short-chain alcohol dehydrogenase family [Sphingobium faniae]|nr:NAD(P)-dependent dehydrogenase, short-chain alcohol dehydrogenase family [Sphingobium faniae]
MALVDGKVALVTAGASGIGRAAARLFAKEGARVCISDIDRAAGEAVVADIAAQGGDAIFVGADIRKEADIIAMVRATVEHFGGLDIAFNNAGLPGHYTDLLNCGADEWNSVVTLNMQGVWLCMKHEIPEMLKRGGGAICNNASRAGDSASAELFAYTATKHAIIGMTRSAAIDLSERNIRVNAILPGPTLTGQLEDCADGNANDLSAIAAVMPMGRLARVDEQAQAAVWLCSDRASYIQGVALCVDGGLSALV